MIEQVTRILHELPQKVPKLNEARLLADAVNLDDFGITGLLLQAIQQPARATVWSSSSMGQPNASNTATGRPA